MLISLDKDFRRGGGGKERERQVINQLVPSVQVPTTRRL